MSRYEWEEGTVTLPSDAAVKVRRTVAEAAVAYRATVERLVAEFWSNLTARSGGDWEEALASFVARQRRWNVDADALKALREVVSMSPQRKPTAATFYAVLGKCPTSRTSTFEFEDAMIVFDGRKVSWIVPENNHAVERARQHPLARTLFKALDKVVWTRQTGGVFVGNDEYNQDCTFEGGGGNYVTARFGPLGNQPPVRARSVRR